MVSPALKKGVAITLALGLLAVLPLDAFARGGGGRGGGSSGSRSSYASSHRGAVWGVHRRDPFPRLAPIPLPQGPHTEAPARKTLQPTAEAQSSVRAVREIATGGSSKTGAPLSNSSGPIRNPLVARTARWITLCHLARVGGTIQATCSGCRGSNTGTRPSETCSGRKSRKVALIVSEDRKVGGSSQRF